MASAQNSPNIGAMNVGDIVSRGWRLYRLNFKEVIIFSLIPTVIFSLAQIPQLVLNSPNAYKENPEMLPLFCCCILPGSYGLLIIGSFIAICLNYFIIKIFYNKLINKQLTFSEIFEEIKTRIGNLILLCILIIFEAVAFYIIDIVLIAIAVVLLVLPISMLSAIGATNPVISFLIGFVFVILLFIAIVLISFFALVQFLVCMLQVVIFVVEKATVLQSFINSFKIPYADISRAFKFIFCLTGLWYGLLIFFNTPAIYYMFYELYREGLTSTEGYPIHVLAVMTFWGDIISMFLWPMVISAVTLFYFDAKVRLEGFDLSLALKTNTQ